METSSKQQRSSNAAQASKYTAYQLQQAAAKQALIYAQQALHNAKQALQLITEANQAAEMQEIAEKAEWSCIYASSAQHAAAKCKRYSKQAQAAALLAS